MMRVISRRWYPRHVIPRGRRARIVLAVWLSFLGFAADIDADALQDLPVNDPPLITLSLDELGHLEVNTASKTPEQVRLIPAAVYVITQEDIRRSGATSIPDVLRLAPGVDVAQIDGAHWSVGVRGFGDQFSKSVLVLIDGRNVYTPLFAGINWPVQDTVLEDIERIEIVRGPGGTIWGANAVNGVINIVTKNTKDTQGTLASIGGGTIDRGIGAIRYGGAHGPDLSYRMYVKAFAKAAQFHTDQHEFDDSRMGQAGFRVDWKARRDTLTIQGDIYKGSDGQSVALGSFSPPSQTISYDPLHVSGGNLLAQWRRDVSATSDIQLHTYYDRTYLLGPQIGETRQTFDVDFIHHTASMARQDVRWGLGARLSPSTIIQTIPTLDVLPHDQTDRIFSAFAQDEITLVDTRLWVTVGSKIEHNDYTGLEVQPSVRLLWTPTGVESVWAAVTRAVRTPSRLEDGLQLVGFLAPEPPVFVRIAGNTAFDVERLLGYEAGYRRAVSPQLYVDFSVFHNHHDDLESFGAGTVSVETTPAPTHIVLTFPYANGVQGTSTGAEIAADWKPARWWQVKGSYSYLHIDLTNQAGNTDTSAVSTYEGSSPRHQAIVQSWLSVPGRWQFDQTFRYVGALPARGVDGYVTADVRLGRALATGFDLSIAGRNLLQPHHVEFGHDPGPLVAIERNVYLSVTWRR